MTQFKTSPSILKYIKERGITEEVINNVKKNSDQSKHTGKLNLVVKSWT